jgi:hypothetical protein
MPITSEFLNVLIAAVAAVVAAIAALAAYFSSTRQNRLTARTAAGDWIRDLRGWASEGIDVLAEASYYCPRDLSCNTDGDRETLKLYRCRISALVDRGRLLLPNTHDSIYGERKEGAYRGYRHHGLDALVAAERVLDGKAKLWGFPDPKVALIGLRREFVSIMQDILDPASMNRAVAELLLEAHEDRKNDRTLGGLLPNPSTAPKGAEGLLYSASVRYTASNRKYGETLSGGDAV